MTFKLSNLELTLYEAVTDYVTKHFDRAKKTENRTVTFAMMIFQRRLSPDFNANRYNQSFKASQLQALPRRAYSDFLKAELEKNRMMPTERIRDIFMISFFMSLRRERLNSYKKSLIKKG